jgi:multidrug efflux pump subunit AcrB/outer membrane protein TolC
MAGRIAAAFIDSRLTPLVILVSLLLGVGATLLLPREEEPQIVVPMADVMVAMPGATAAEVEQQVTTPMEKLIKRMEGVEYVYSISRPGEALIIVRFYVGQNPEAALVRLYNELYSNQDRVPPGVLWPPLIKPRSIDDVPVLALTLHGGGLDGFQLRRLAAQLDEQIKQVEDVSVTELIGGLRREVRVEVQPDRLAAYGLSPARVLGALRAANAASRSGRIDENGTSVVVRSGDLLGSADDVGSVVVATEGQRPVYLRDVATIGDGPSDPATYVWFAGRGHDEKAFGAPEPAVTISIAKRRGSNAVVVVDHVLEKLEKIRANYLPRDVALTVTRNYGETAAERSNELLRHMGIAVLSVVALMWLTLGHRESVVVAIAIPVTLALTVCTFVLYNFSLNRVTFFALIFSIGILVDDAIVVVENVVRHLRMPENHGRSPSTVVLEAVSEVGNPTILATLTVMAAILPMAFVRGLMGPYMRPIPLGASAAMAFSMLVAFAVIPWASVRILGRSVHGHGSEEREDALTRLYRWLMQRLIHRPLWRATFLIGIVVLLLASVGMMAGRLVIFKMLPFDNKSEFQVLINMPEGSTLETTAAATREIAAWLATVPEVTDTEGYVGTASPFNFNGLVRHYFTRSGPNLADLQVNLQPKSERKRSSHDIARTARPEIEKIARKWHAVVQVAEIPPGPPVLQTLVTEVYGPRRDGQIALAREVKDLYAKSPGVVDVDWYLERPQPELRLHVDREKAALNRLGVDDVTAALDTAIGGTTAGLLHDPAAREPVPIVVRLPYAARSVEGLEALQVGGVPLASLVRTENGLADTSIYHKNLQPVVYVIGDVAGRIDSPLYSILDIQKGLDNLRGADGRKVTTWFLRQPPTNESYSVKWDGEWQVTYEVFRDLGIAFAVVMVLIYVLVVGWFQDFMTPLVIVSAIPFSLVGIMPGHWLFGAFFSATSMIGFIAGAGIVVRNSIILVDFMELRLAQGMPLEEAVVDAGAVRFRPMLLTASAVVVGSLVMLADPIFQGLAISLMAGEVASLLLSRTAVPVLYYLLWRGRRHPAAPNGTAVGILVVGLALLALMGTAVAAPTATRAVSSATAAPAPTASRAVPSPSVPVPAASPAPPSPSVSPPASAAPSPSTTPLPLTLAQAEERALKTSPRLEGARWKVTEAEQAVELARAPGRTQIGFEGGYTWLSPTLNFGPYPLQVHDNFSTGLMVRQTLDIAGRLHWGVEAARLQVLAARAEEEQRRQDLLLEVREAYAQALLARDGVRILEERRAADLGHLEVARTRYEAGTAARFEILALESSVAQIDSALVRGRNDRAVAFSRLAILIGVEADTPLDLAPLEPSASPQPPSEVDASPRLEVVRRAVAVAQARVEGAKTENRARVDLVGGYARRNSTAFQTADLFQVGLQLNLPLADGGATRARVGQARAVVRELQSQLDEARRNLALDVREAQLAYEGSLEREKAAERAIASADEALRVAKIRYKGGVSTPVEILDAQAACTRAEVELTAARYAEKIARWRWLHAVGRDEE